MADDQSALARRYVEEVINGKNVDALADLFTPTVTFRDPAAPGGVVQGIDHLTGFLAAVFTAFPDFRFAVDALFGAGDQIGWRGTVHGTHQGQFGPIPPTGKAVSLPIAEFYRVVDGRFADAWVYFDSGELMRQLGVSPLPAAD